MMKGVSVRVVHVSMYMVYVDMDYGAEWACDRAKRIGVWIRHPLLHDQQIFRVGVDLVIDLDQNRSIGGGGRTDGPSGRDVSRRPTAGAKCRRGSRREFVSG